MVRTAAGGETPDSCTATLGHSLEWRIFRACIPVIADMSADGRSSAPPVSSCLLGGPRLLDISAPTSRVCRPRLRGDPLQREMKGARHDREVRFLFAPQK